ncbi:MAG: FecR domain-containing protein [Chthoniobacterales bacterium]
MKTSPVSGQFQDLCSLGRKSRLFWLGLILAAVALAPVGATTLKQARVSQVVKDVNLLPNQAAPHPAKVSDEVHDGTAVRTGTESRAELTFTDQTIARLGANTIFSFNEGTRNLDLGGGAMLLRVPKNSGGAQIRTAAVTAAITGTTVMLEFHPDSYIKFIILEGTGRIFRKGQTGESVLVHAGQMLIVDPKGKGLPDPVDVDVGRIMQTSLLITGFPPLPSLGLIAREIDTQDESKSNGALIQTNLVIFGGGTTVSLLDPTQTNVVNQANSTESRQAMLSPTATPAVTVTPTPPPPTPPPPTPPPPTPPPPTPPPTPSKYGTLPVITAPNPYIITNKTTIQTDPAITTNGQTDYGKIYRGPAQDGLPSAYLFGTTSTFDTAIGFDQNFEDVNLLPLAAFKFSALDITGDPSITIPAGSTPNLALISVGDITSGPPGGILTFTGLNSLLLATQAGSITLSSDLSFENIPSLAFYARGTGSNLTLDSTISGTTDLFLGAEGNIVSNGALAITQTNNGLSVGLFAAVAAGNAITLANGLSIVNDNSGGGNLVAGGTITVTAGGALAAGGDLTLNVLNNSGGHIGTGGNIFVTTGGDLTAGTVSALVNNRDGGTIDTGGDLNFDIGGALNATGDAVFVISNRNDGAGGGMIGSDVVLNLDAASISTGGLLNLAISANAGGVIPSATLNLTAGNVVATGGIVSLIQCTGFNAVGGPFIGGGTINGDALLNMSLGDVTTGNVFQIVIASDGTGLIGGNALMSVYTTGNLNVQNDIFNDVINTADLDGSTLVPGGTITGDASVNTVVTGNIVAAGTGEFAVLNNDMRALAGGGAIGGNATVSVGANSLSTGTVFQPLVNDRNGSVGGNATVSVAVTNDITVATDTLFTILNNGGDIGGDALGTLSARNSTSANSFNFQNY